MCIRLARGLAPALRRPVQVLHEAEPLSQPEQVVARVDLPPAEALGGGARRPVMIVVPALAHREEREEEAVARVVGRREHAAAEEVHDAVDREGAVPEEDGREEVAVEEADRSETEIQRDAVEDGREVLVLVEPYELGVLREVRHAGVVRLLVVRREDPADVRPPEPALHRAVDVFRPVRIPVVVAMVGGPPEHALLRRGLAEDGQQELGHARKAIRAVAEVAVEPGGHREHPQVVRAETEGDPFPGEAQGEDAEGGDVHAEEAGERGGADPPALRRSGRFQGGTHPQTLHFRPAPRDRGGRKAAPGST